MTAPRLGPRVGVCGTFDLANYGDLLFPRIFELEISRRLPLADIRSYGPLGHLHPVAMDGGRPALPLGRPDSVRRNQIAGDLDLFAVGGGEIAHLRDDVYGSYYGLAPAEATELAPSGWFVDGLGAERERLCPVVWNAVGVPFPFEGDGAERVRRALSSKAYVSVRDEASRARLLETGTDREVHVVPDSGLLVRRLFSREVLERRLRFLRAMGWYPEHGQPLVVQGSAWIRSGAPAVAHALKAALRGKSIPIVLVETGPCHGDAEFADAVAALLPGEVYRLPGAVSLADIATTIAHARAYAGLSLHGAVTARAYDVPFLVLNLAGYSKLLAFADLVDRKDALVSDADALKAALRRLIAEEAPLAPGIRPSLEQSIDAHFDAIAEIAERSWHARLARDGSAGLESQLSRALADSEARRQSLERAFAARGERLLEERLRLVEIIEGLESHNGAGRDDAEQTAGLKGDLERLDSAYAAARLEAETLSEENRSLRAELDRLPRFLQVAGALSRRVLRR